MRPGKHLGAGHKVFLALRSDYTKIQGTNSNSGNIKRIEKMATPKSKTSKARSAQRRSHDALNIMPCGVCKACGEKKRPHHVCPACGAK